MKQAVKILIYHILIIIIFAILYYHFSDDYSKTGDRLHVIDYILLSTTVQAGVGISDIHPITFYGKFILITQQILMIMAHVFTIYFFTL